MNKYLKDNLILGDSLENFFGWITLPFGPLLEPPEGLRALGVPGVNPWGRPQESGGDSKVI